MKNQTNQKKSKYEGSDFDYSLLFVVLFLLIFGIIMIYSSSSYVAERDFHDSMHFLKRQLISVIIGLLAMVVVIFCNYKRFVKFGTIAYVVSLILVFLLLVVGRNANGATRWIPIFGGFNIQPAEVAKTGMILFLASFISKYPSKVDTKEFMMIVGAATITMVGAIYFISKNLSSALIVFGIVYLMMFVASKQYKKYIVATLIMVIGVVILVALILSGNFNSGFRSERIIAWTNPENSPKGFQTVQALYAIGSGGFAGKGLGASMQKLGFIPEAQNDMIFSIICEELGLFGAICVIALFAIFIWKCVVIAVNVDDIFGSMLVIGVMAHVGIQVILNIAVVTNTIPNTGISLPFISYGGSSVLFLLIEIGMVLSVSRKSHGREKRMKNEKEA